MNSLTRAIILFSFGVLVLAGGTIGYLKANSLISLAMGCSISIMAFILSYGISQNYPKAFYSSLTLVACTGLFFVYRFWLTQNFMPAGLMSAFSLLTFGLLLCRKSESNSSARSSKL